jgi:hypothetical protein
MNSSILRFSLSETKESPDFTTFIIVGEGVLFPSGRVVLEWTQPSSLSIYESITALYTTLGLPRAHGPGYSITWIDGVCPACGSDFIGSRIAGTNGYCWICNSTWDGPPSVNLQVHWGLVKETTDVQDD